MQQSRLGIKELRFNLIGYNLGSYACRYLVGPAADLKILVLHYHLMH